MTTAFPWLVIGGFAGAATLFYYMTGDAEAAGPDIAPREPKVIPPPNGPSKLPTDEPEEDDEVLPPNLFFVDSVAVEDAVSSMALQQSGTKEGIVLAIYRPAAGDIIRPEMVIAATSFPDVTFLVYPEAVSKQMNPTAIVPHACGPYDIVSLQGFPTVLTQQGFTWGSATVHCVAAPNALELRAALSTTADSVV